MLALNLLHCTVSSVRVNSVPCAYQCIRPLYYQPFLNEVSSRQQLHRIRDIHFSDNSRGEKWRHCGELLINILASCSADKFDKRSRLNRTTAHVPKCEPNPNDSSALPPPPVTEYDSPMVPIDIDCEVLDPSMKFVLLLPSRSNKSTRSFLHAHQ